MAGSPVWKIYNPHRGKTKKGEYIAACKYPEDAAALASVTNCNVWHDHTLLVWDVSKDGNNPTTNSYDEAAQIMEDRRIKHSQEALDKIYAKARQS